MADDWRVTVTLREGGHAGRLLLALHAQEVEGDARGLLGDRIAVSSSADQVFLYADTESAAHAAERVVAEVLSADGVDGEFSVERWHHDEEEWEDATVPVPATAAARDAEHEQLEKDETAESQASGVADWEVRVQLASHQDARTLAERLEQEGFGVVRRWTFLLIGVGDEDDANVLAARLKSEAPAGATIEVEPGSGLAWQLMPSNPFAVFGGLAG